jgi:hypothetical protein
MHREFISRVAGQVCPPELESKIASDMNVLSTNVNSTYRFERSGTAPNSVTDPKHVPTVTFRSDHAEQKRIEDDQKRVQSLPSVQPVPPPGGGFGLTDPKHVPTVTFRSDRAEQKRIEDDQKRQQSLPPVPPPPDGFGPPPNTFTPGPIR